MEDDNAEYLDEFFLTEEPEEQKPIIFEREINQGAIKTLKKEKKPKVKKTQSNKKPKAARKNDEITLYAYKYCLGLCDSLIANDKMPLWYRDGDFLLQKFLRHSQDEDGLIYEGTRTYSCWMDEHKEAYLEVKALVTDTNNYGSPYVHISKVKILNHNLLDMENKCIEGNFSLLNLPPYESKSDPNNNFNDSMVYPKSEPVIEEDQEMDVIEEYIET